MGIDELIRNWDALLRDIPDLKGKLVDRLGRTMLGVVQRKIGGAGKVQGWQDCYLGSKRGYAAVRPRAKSWVSTAGGKRYAVGQVTNAIDSGHHIRRASGELRDGYRYRPRIKTAYVDGKHFYAGSEAEAKQAGEAAVRALALELAGRLGGGGP